MTAIVAAKRTPFGSFGGSLARLSATDLGGYALKAVFLPDCFVDYVYMGCVLQAGLGQAPARQAAYKGGLSWSVPTVTYNKVCGSGLQAIIAAHQDILLGEAHVVLAGGMENLSQSPYSIARLAPHIGHRQTIDLLLRDGLEDSVTCSGQVMGALAEETARTYNISRTEQELYTEESYVRFQKAQPFFNHEITPLELASMRLTEDEPPARVKIGKFSSLKPAFKKEGTITAATSSSLADGAAAVCLMSRSHVQKQSLTPLAWIAGYAVHAQEPTTFASAPIHAVERLCQKLHWSIHDVDYFEVNEAFAVVPLAFARILSVPLEKINPHGGACIIGHPLGATGARLVVTLAHTLNVTQKQRGIAVACIGGGEAIAIALERTLNVA